MKRIVLILLSLIIALGVLSGCNSAEKNSSGKINIVTTIFPIYDWTSKIAGDKADVTMLLDNGVDMHSFQPSAEDIVNVSGCDMFIYVGGESDSWVEDALKEKVNKDMVVINLMDVLKDDLKEEEKVEGMEGAADGNENDEHIWLSLRNAEKCALAISEKLSKLDSKNKNSYEKNTDNYINKLQQLDEKYEETVKSSDKNTMVFADRFPFRYLADDYGLKYYAAFSGCSAETEASFNTITFLAEKVDEYKLGAILKIETSDKKLAETVRDNTKTKNQKILTLDSMQNKTIEDVKKKVSYISVMENNSKILKEALK
jgi:zinc transport system substrate-binding protein